jgi:hypothetical protein
MATDFSGDTNATAIGKLPPPIVQSKSGVQFDVPNYSEMAKAALEAPPPHHHQAGSPQQAYDMHRQVVTQQHQQQQQMMMLPQQPALMEPAHQQHQQQVMEQQLQHMARQVRAQRQQLKAAARRETFVNQRQPNPWLDWRQYKPGLLVAAIVLVMLVYGVPRIKASIPQLVSPLGRLNHLGYVVVSLLTGVAYQASSKFVLQ